MSRRKTTDKANPTKATDFEAQKRVNTVYNMLLLGVGRADIIEFAEENWKIGEGQTDAYIAKANAVFAEQSKTVRNDEFGKAVSRLQTLFQKNMKIQDYKAALATQKELNALLGLYAPETTTIRIEDETFSDEERIRRIATLFDKARERRAKQAAEE